MSTPQGGKFKQNSFFATTRLETKRDVGIADLRKAVGDFSDRAQDADVAVVFFAGHGIEVDGTNYLVPADANSPAISTSRTKRCRSTVCRKRSSLPNACGW